MTAGQSRAHCPHFHFIAPISFSHLFQEFLSQCQQLLPLPILHYLPYPKAFLGGCKIAEFNLFTDFFKPTVHTGDNLIPLWTTAGKQI